MADKCDLLIRVQHRVQQYWSDSGRQASLDNDDKAPSPRLMRRVSALRVLQGYSDSLEAEYKKERISLENKYHGIFEPYLTRRDEFVSGEVDVLASEGDKPEEMLTRGIPGYWTQCLVNHPAIQLTITPEDIPALDALSNIVCEYNVNYTAFILRFYFDDNEYFENKVLEKMYLVSPDLLDIVPPTLIDHTATEIEWKPTKNLCVVESKKKKISTKGRNKGQSCIVSQLEVRPSFFHFFSLPTDDDEDFEQLGRDLEGYAVTFSREDDYEIATCIRTAIIPASVTWYTGEAVQEDYPRDCELYDEDGSVSPCPVPLTPPVPLAAETETEAGTAVAEAVAAPRVGGRNKSKSVTTECKQS